MSAPPKAVFLSYASQDAAAAKRIADALRAAGVEVWFDTDGGLEQGDEWDAKIRRQIKECVLFIPIISANTQAREEGYFRLEWDLAAERARTIASGVAFILPVVIDDTREPVALVPDRFRTVQWTRLPSGTVPADVLQRFLKLWSHRTGLLKHAEAVGGALRPDSSEESGRKAPPTIKPSPRWLVPAIVSVVAVASAAFWFVRRTAPDVRPETPDARPQTLDQKLTESRQLVARAWEQMNKAGLARAELELADGLCQRAIALDPNDAGAWAAASQVDAWYVYHNLDASAARREGARTKAARALQLAPDSFEARLAHACQLVRSGGHRHVSVYADEAEGLLRTLLREQPDEPRTLLALGILLRNTGRLSECREVLTRLANNPAFAALAWNEIGWALYITANDYPAAETAADASISLQPYWGNLLLKFLIVQRWWGDLDLAKTTVERIPSVVRQEDAGVSVEVALYHWRREPEEMLRVLAGVSRDWLQSNQYTGPKAYWSGLAHAMAGRTEAARLQWQAALKLVEQRLADQPGSGFLLRSRARFLALLGQRDEAETALRLFREIGGVESYTLVSVAGDLILLGRHEEAIAALERGVEERTRHLTAAFLRLAPTLDPLREEPRFQALLARMEADPRFSATTKSIPAPSSLLHSPSRPPSADAKSVAVLAFANLSDDKANEYFSDGISEELLNVLAKVPGLKVSARTSAFYFKGKEVPIPEIAKQLGVAYIVEGSVRKQGDKVRITAQLIKAADGFHVWSDTFTRDLKDIFAVQDEIAGLISQQLQLKLGSVGPARAVNPEALNLLLEARHHWNQRGEQNFDRAEALLHRALAIDPAFARAHAALADVWLMRATYRLLDGGANVAPELQNLRVSATRASELDPDLVDPVAARAYGLMLENRMEESGRLFADVLRRSPANPTFLYWRALYLMNQGDFHAARRDNEKARRYDPMAFIIWQNSAECSMAFGHYDEAATQAARANEVRAGGFVQSVATRAMATWLAGRHEEALALARSTRQPELQQLRWIKGAYAIWVLRQAGFEAEATAYGAEELPALPVRSYQRGFLLASLGRFAEAYPYLEGTPPYIYYLLASSPIFDPCREDPQFKALVETLHWSNSYAEARATRLESLVTLEEGK